MAGLVFRTSGDWPSALFFDVAAVKSAARVGCKDVRGVCCRRKKWITSRWVDVSGDGGTKVYLSTVSRSTTARLEVARDIPRHVDLPTTLPCLPEGT